MHRNTYNVWLKHWQIQFKKPRKTPQKKTPKTSAISNSFSEFVQFPLGVSFRWRTCYVMTNDPWTDWHIMKMRKVWINLEEGGGSKNWQFIIKAKGLGSGGRWDTFCELKVVPYSNKFLPHLNHRFTRCPSSVVCL